MEFHVNTLEFHISDTRGQLREKIKQAKQFQ